jgi:putative NADPH-quinone reductase
MRALVVYCHPHEGSFTAAVRDLVLDKLRSTGAEYKLVDLYADQFQPVLSPEEWAGYENSPANRAPVEAHCAAVEWCDTLIFVYPTWWYGLPAMLKGWLDRVMLPDVAFLMPDAVHKNIRPGLRHITRLAVFTTGGASWWLMRWVGAPGNRTLFRGLGLLIHPRAKKAFAAHYLMDSSTDATRARHLARVGARMDRFLGARAPTLSHSKEAAS